MILKTIFLILLSIKAKSVHVDPETSLFVDQYGRYRVYHGVNAVYKAFPFHPDTENFDTNNSLTERDLLNLKSWGMNVIRLHAAWEGVEPEKGVYNYSYVEKLREIVRSCNKYDIMVLLDAHQDLYSKQFCGEGLPTWTAQRISFPAPLKVTIRIDKDGFPMREDCLKVPFAEFYLTYDVMRMQHDLFSNERQLLDHLVKFWEIIASYMSNEPNIIGYEFINEPIGEDGYTNLEGTLIGGVSNNKYLLPAYKRIYSAIKKYDMHHNIFFEPSILDILGEGFIDTPGSDLKTQVLSYHVYCPYVTLQGEPKSTLICQSFDALTIASKEENIKRIKVGGFLTEYGALSGTEKSAEEIVTITELIRQNYRSWTYWQFKYYQDFTTAANPGTTESFYDEYGELQINKVRALARPYSYALCGRFVKETFKKGIYNLKWFAENDCMNKNTEIFLSEEFYFEKGFTVVFKNCEKCLLKKTNFEKSYYEIVLNSKIKNKLIEIIISPVK